MQFDQYISINQYLFCDVGHQNSDYFCKHVSRHAQYKQKKSKNCKNAIIVLHIATSQCDFWLCKGLIKIIKKNISL